MLFQVGDKTARNIKLGTSHWCPNLSYNTTTNPYLCSCMFFILTSCGVITITWVNSCTVLRADPGTCFQQPFSWGLGSVFSVLLCPCAQSLLWEQTGPPFGGFCLRWFTALASQSDRCGWGTGPHHFLLATGRVSLHSVSTAPKQSWWGMQS